MRKIIIALLLTVVLCGIGHDDATILASEYLPENVKTITTTTKEMEYIEYLSSLLSLTDEELLSKGFTLSEIEEMRNYDYNADLLKLKKHDSRKLKAMGYSSEQIERIQEYNGLDNAIEYASTYNLSNAELKGTHWITIINEGNTVAIKYRFIWTQAPIFCHTDSVALAWVGCDRNSHEVVMEVDGEKHTVYHHDMSSDSFVKTTKANVLKELDTREIKFQMQSSQEAAEYYTKKVEGEVRIKTLANSYNLEQVMVRAAYGHTVLGKIPGSISISTEGMSLSIEVGWNQEELYNECESFLAYEIKTASE